MTTGHAETAAGHGTVGLHPWQGVWRLADPKITLASAAAMLLGAALAAADGPIEWGWLVLTVAGIFCLEAAKNASGEVFDWDSGVDEAVRPEDRSPFSGGKRVIVDGMLSRNETILVAALFYAAGGVAGAVIALAHEPDVLWIGLVGAVLAFEYHGPPLRLSYRGLGELAVAVTYGPLITTGTYLVQRHEVPARVLLAAIPIGLLVGAFLWINELPDRRADQAGGKRTLVVRLGARRAAIAFAVLVAVAFAALALLPLSGLPTAVWLGAAGVPFAAAAARRLLARPATTAAIVPAQAWTLLSFVLTALGMAVGLVLAA